MHSPPESEAVQARSAYGYQSHLSARTRSRLPDVAAASNADCDLPHHGHGVDSPTSRADRS
eukprot:10127442-Alexandrium_andersonii.AAC.1